MMTIGEIITTLDNANTTAQDRIANDIENLQEQANVIIIPSDFTNDVKEILFLNTIITERIDVLWKSVQLCPCR
jgi:plasmid replication initiation protein